MVGASDLGCWCGGRERSVGCPEVASGHEVAVERCVETDGVLSGAARARVVNGVPVCVRR